MPKNFRPSWMPSKKENDKWYNRFSRNRKSANFYGSKDWKTLRAYKMALNPLCEIEGCNKLAEIVHHLEPLDKCPEKAFDLDNLQSVCRRHHNTIHKSKGEDDGQ